MGELTKEDGQGVPGARAFARRPGGFEGSWPTEGVGAGLASSPNPSTVGPRLDHGRRGECCGHVPAGGSADRVALPEGWACRGSWRGREAQGSADAGRAEGGGDRGDGLRAATAGSGAVDVDADRRGGGSPKDRRHGGPRDDPQDAESPRAEAVAGKKWLSSTSNG